jgi:hypothetical protein
METMTREPLKKVMDDVLIYIKENVYLKFTKVFQFPGSSDAFIAHFNIWDDNAPFYILYDRKSLKRLQIKGYSKCLFIPNSFVIGYDKNNKMYLRCTDIYPDCYLKYYPITSVKDIRNLVELRNKQHQLYAGFVKSDKLAIHGEAIELITVSNTY